MGTDLSVVNSARVSFHKESDWETVEDKDGDWKEVLSEQDQKLIIYLAKHNHFTPFTHVQITLREKVPIFVARQRYKHTIGFSYNEVSRRYVDDTPEFFFPDVWRGRPVGAKQGSSDEVIEDIIHPTTGEKWNIKSAYDDVMKELTHYYETLINAGVAPEQARMVLPQSMFTEYIVTGSLAAWARAYKLRIDPHSQLEIQSLAKKWQEIIGSIEELKYSWSALTM